MCCCRLDPEGTALSKVITKFAGLGFYGFASYFSGTMWAPDNYLFGLNPTQILNDDYSFDLDIFILIYIQVDRWD